MSINITKKPTISVIIPNFNGRDLLEKNLSSIIEAFKNKDNNIIEIIIVDNGSKDFSVKFLKRYYPEVKIIKHKFNRGFSAALNTGARSAHGILLAFLTNEVKVKNDFLIDSLNRFDDEKLFAVAFNDGLAGWVKGRIDKGYVFFESVKNSLSFHDTFFVDGKSGLFSREKWISLGGMDEKLYKPNEWLSADLSYRAWKRGWQCLWEPKSKISYLKVIEPKDSQKHPLKKEEYDQLIFIWKNITSQNLFKKHLISLFRYTIRHPLYLFTIISVMFKLLIILKSRKKEKKESKFSDEIIFDRLK
jgi:GT2 family glycosyltransferase